MRNLALLYDFRPLSPSRHNGFEKKQYVENLQHAVGPQMIGVYMFSPFSHPSPISTGGQKVGNFSLILRRSVFEREQHSVNLK